MKCKSPCRGIVGAALVLAMGHLAAVCPAQDKTTVQPTGKKTYRGLLGPDNHKIRREGDKTFLWAGGARPGSQQAEWYDFTSSPIPPADLQFGIGKDRIRAIDDPVFVSPDDPRLLKLPTSRYRGDPRPKSNDDIIVMGYVNGDEARAYPIGLLDHHELVNDRINGKPVTVGW